MITEPVKFLIVDDKEENLLAMEALLRRDELEILQARSSAEALELLLVHKVALAILDVQMPETDGFELAELMRGVERCKHVPIIFVTAGARDPMRIFKGYDAGAVDVLFKPIDPHVLKSKADVFFELYRQQQECANALRLSEMFVAILGHDLRNPLYAILNGAELLKRQLADEKQLRTVERMISAGDRMTDMIEQMLDLTRARLADGLGFVRTRQSLDVGDLVQRAAEELRIAHPQREIVIEACGDLSTSGDPHRLLQLFSNVVANALHHGAAGSPISVKVEGREREIVVRVRNRGVIPPELLPTIFDPFRSRKMASSSRGLGLGLFISQQIAFAHGGQVEIASKQDTGTLLTIRLPRVLLPEKSKPAVGTPKTILIVDEDSNIRESLRQAFEEQGYLTVMASSGREALALLHQQDRRPDVVVLDLVLPAIGGTNVYNAMQNEPALAHIPVIVAAADRAQAPAGAIVLPKPLRLTRLLATVAGLWREEV